MNLKRIAKISVLTLPLAIILFLFFDLMQSSIMGGIATVQGFPISYYYDVWSTPNVEWDYPPIILVDILIIYSILTLLVYFIWKKK